MTAATICGVQAEVKSVPVQPGKGIVIAVLGDTIRADDWSHLRDEVAAFYQATSDKETIRIATLTGGGVRFAGPFSSAALLRSALDEMNRPTPGTPRMIAPDALYTQMGTAGSQLGSSWSATILVGRFPDVPPDLLPYTQAWLSGRLRTAKVRVYYWQMSGGAAGVMDATVRTTGGLRLTNGLSGSADLVAAGLEFHEVSWQNPVVPGGFRLCPTTLGGAGGEMSPFLNILATAGAEPTIERYGVLREKTRAVAEALRQPQLSQQQAGQADADLTDALAINSHDEEALRLGVDLYKRSANDAKLAAVLDGLTALAPDDVALFHDLGRTRYRMQDWAAAERALSRARELTPLDASVAEDLARVHLGRSDDRGALPFLEARLALGSPSQELWLTRADIAARLGDWEREADSIEHALSLGGVSLDRRGALIRLYIEHQQPAKALVHVRAVAETLPLDRAIREEYARFLDELQPDVALAAWKRTLEADPRSELAHYRITQILTEQNPIDALHAAEAGIAAVPVSARLYLAKSQIQDTRNQYYPARATLRQAVARLPQVDAPFLSRLAEMEDAGGVDAARYYQQLVEVLEKTSAASTERSTALQRGLDAALRDADIERVKWFQARLLGPPTAGDRPLVQTRGGSVLIPGGLAALSFISRSRPAPPDRFLVDYARTIARNGGGPDKKVADAYISNIREYFRRVNELAALGVRQGDRVTITLDLKDRNGQRNAEKILDLLGWRMESNREGVKLNPIEKGSKTARQQTASALAIDEIGMQQNLESGKPFSFDIHYGVAAALLGEEAWRTQFYGNENYPGGLAEAIVNDLELAQIYAGLGQMDGATAAALISGTPLKRLADQSAELLFRYSSAMAVDRGRVVVPGGNAAALLWSNLAHVSPDQPGPFFRALLARDGGELLAFYAAVSALDLPHQRFFTRTPERLNNFYELFRDAPETQRSASWRIQAGPFAEFLAEVPLDRDGNLDFPGSPEVWMVAKGQSDDVAKMMKEVKRAAAPEVEDQILLRLAGTRYKKAGVVQGELDNFLAVVRIDSRRTQPLDQASALYLAQHFDDDEAVYPYFAVLTGLKEKQFREFFELSDAMRLLEGLEKNAALGTFHSLVKILCLAQQSGRARRNAGRRDIRKNR